MGNFNNFENTVEQQPPHAHAPMDEGATPQPLSGNGGRRGNNFNLQQVNSLILSLFVRFFVIIFSTVAFAWPYVFVLFNIPTFFLRCKVSMFVLRWGLLVFGIKKVSEMERLACFTGLAKHFFYLFF